MSTDVSTENKKNNTRKKPPKLETLYNYCLKWEWINRAEAYDQYQQELINNEVFEELLSFKKEQIKIAKERINYTTKNLQEVTNDKELSNKDKAYSIAKSNEGYDRAIDSFYKIANEGKIVTENTNVNTNKDINIFEGEEEALERIKQRKKDES